jgi:hypothetical protein
MISEQLLFSIDTISPMLLSWGDIFFAMGAVGVFFMGLIGSRYRTHSREQRRRPLPMYLPALSDGDFEVEVAHIIRTFFVCERDDPVLYSLTGTELRQALHHPLLDVLSRVEDALYRTRHLDSHSRAAILALLCQYIKIPN